MKRENTLKYVGSIITLNTTDRTGSFISEPAIEQSNHL